VSNKGATNGIQRTLLFCDGVLVLRCRNVEHEQNKAYRLITSFVLITQPLCRELRKRAFFFSSILFLPIFLRDLTVFIKE
jgi:hypothetical protein